MMHRGPRWFVLVPLLAALSCASAGDPDTPPLEVGGVWSFSVVLDSSIDGRITFLPDDWVVVRCNGEQGPLQPWRRVTYGAEVRFTGCGLEYRVMADDEGGLYAMVKGQVQEPYQVPGACEQWRRDADGTEVCLAYDMVVRYRTRTVYRRVDLVPSGLPGVGPRPSTSRQLGTR